MDFLIRTVTQILRKGFALVLFCVFPGELLEWPSLGPLNSRVLPLSQADYQHLFQRVSLHSVAVST